MTFILNQMEEGIEMEKKLEPYHFYDIVRMMKEIFPEMELGEDNYNFGWILFSNR